MVTTRTGPPALESIPFHHWWKSLRLGLCAPFVDTSSSAVCRALGSPESPLL